MELVTLHQILRISKSWKKHTKFLFLFTGLKTLAKQTALENEKAEEHKGLTLPAKKGKLEIQTTMYVVGSGLLSLA